MIECPHRCMHDQFCKKFLNHHCCTHVMEIMWDTFLYPWTTGQTNTSTYIMFSRSISLEPKSQLTINLDPGWKCPSLPLKAKRKEKKILDQRLEESKKKKKENSRSKIRRKQKKYAERSLDQTISEQYRVVTTKQEKRGNHDFKWSSPFDRQPKYCALATFSPRTKQKQKKRKRPKHSKPNPLQKHHSWKSPIDPWSRM